MTETISIHSGKGGTGKTFTAANLSLALQELGEQVVCIDTDLNSANLAFQLGNEPENYTLEDAIQGKINPLKAVSVHDSGLLFIPPSLHLVDETLSTEKLNRILRNFSGFADRVIIDAPPGFGESFWAVLEVSDKVLVVTNPELQALRDAKKIVDETWKANVEVEGLILNKSEGLLEEVPVEEVERTTDSEVLLKIPYRREVVKSIHRKEPLALDKHSEIGVEFKKLAAELSGKRYRPAWYSPLIRLGRKIWRVG